MSILLERCQRPVVTVGSAVADLDRMRVRNAQLTNLMKLRFGRWQLIRRLTSPSRFKLTALFEAQTEVMLALCRCRFRNNRPVKDVMNRLLDATSILRCVVHFECAEIEIWFDSIHIGFNVFGVSFHLFRDHEVGLLLFVRFNVAVLESGARDVIILRRNIGLAELSDKCHALVPGLRVVRYAVIREIVIKR